MDAGYARAGAGAFSVEEHHKYLCTDVQIGRLIAV